MFIRMMKKASAVVLMLILLVQLALPVNAIPEDGVCGENLTWYVSSGVLYIEGSGEMYNYAKGNAPYAPWHSLSISQVSFPEGMTSIGNYAFYNCSGLTSIDIPDSTVTIGEGAFDYCKNLTSVNVSGQLAEIGNGAFRSCSNLNDVVIPESVETIGDYAFYCCYSLSSITIPAGVTSIGRACFTYCQNLSFISVVDDNAFYCNDDTGILYNKSKSELIQSPCGKSGTIVIPETVTEIADYAFEGSELIEYVTFPDNLVRIGDHAFDGCISLSAAMLPEGLTNIGEYAFDYCLSLETVNIPSTVESIRYAVFGSCPLISEIVIPEGVAEIEPYAFSNCSNLSSVILPTSLICVDRMAFYMCENLATINLPSNLHSIEDYAFQNSGLSYLQLPEQLDHIGVGAFANCTSLKSITLPAGLRSVEHSAFALSGLTELVVRNPYCLVAANKYFYNYHIGGENGEPGWDSITVTSTLGIPEQTVIYGQHHTELAALNFIPGNAAYDNKGDFIGYYQCLYAEAYANAFGYTYCATDVFQDVAENSYYEIPVAWAYSNGITVGTGENVFSPGKHCTREQIVTFLWRASGSPEPESSTCSFTDVMPTAYYYKAVLWAKENGITEGFSNSTFGVGRPCTRAQAVTFLWRKEGMPQPTISSNPFSDIKPSDYYYSAVLWAYENNTTRGTSDNLFSPHQACTRSQIVTFLYRHLN